MFIDTTNRMRLYSLNAAQPTMRGFFSNIGIPFASLRQPDLLVSREDRSTQVHIVRPFKVGAVRVVPLPRLRPDGRLVALYGLGRRRADDGGVRYYIAGEYKPVANGSNLVRQHAVRVGESRTAECGYTFSALDRSMSAGNPYDWEDPRWMLGGMSCQECVDATGTPA